MTRCTFTFLLCVCASFVLRAQEAIPPVPHPDAPVIKFDSLTYWFDTVYQSSTVDHEFRFTNTGKTLLIISTVTGSSGCIVPYYPKEPIAPGQSAMIRVVFNTSGKYGPQQKTVTVTSNATEPTIALSLKGVVISAPSVNQFTDPVPQLKIDSATYKFGTAPQNDTVYHDFVFTNSGKAPLLISSVIGNDGSAMCVSYPHGSIRAGASGVIRVAFITTGKSGYCDQSFIITSNSKSGDAYLHVMGTVVARGNK